MVDKITYNEYGNIQYPNNISKAIDDLGDLLVESMSDLSPLEMRAVMSDVNLFITNRFCEVILRKQVQMKKTKKVFDEFAKR